MRKLERIEQIVPLGHPMHAYFVDDDGIVFAEPLVCVGMRGDGEVVGLYGAPSSEARHVGTFDRTDTTENFLGFAAADMHEHFEAILEDDDNQEDD